MSSLRYDKAIFKGTSLNIMMFIQENDSEIISHDIAAILVIREKGFTHLGI